MITQAKRILRAAHLEDLGRALHHNMRRFKRRILGVDKRLVRDYLASYPIKKLHIGCGSHIIDGWLNSDFLPPSRDILQLDATSRFPFSDEVFDYIFSEHMIEHLSYPQGAFMLSECHRILRQGGKVRISTPDLAFLINLYGHNKSLIYLNYIKWATDAFIQTAPEYMDTFVINNFVRAWDHLFIYDEKTLRLSLENSGFVNVVRCETNASEDKTLCGLECEKNLPEGFYRLETVTLEGTKRSGAALL